MSRTKKSLGILLGVVVVALVASSLTASVGIALYDPQLHLRREDLLKDAEIAMAHAKKKEQKEIKADREQRVLSGKSGKMRVIDPSSRPTWSI